jgi:hypothetical protein
MNRAPAAVLALLTLCACKKDGAKPAPGGAEDTAAVGDCPAPGMSMARVMTPDDAIPGDAAVGTAGDFILQNGHAAYVITEPGKGSTYYHYGGIVADAVPMDGCAWAGEDKLDEVGLVLAEVNLASFNQSVLRGFRGDTAEVLSDGSDGGAAVVRVTGSDDYFWVVEYTLISSAIDEGGKPLSEPFGVEIVVDHILEPGSPVLRTEVSLQATGDTQRELALAGLISLGPTLDLHGYAPQRISPFGLDLGFGMPWLVATDGEGAIAYAVEDGSLGYVSISGVNAAVDIQQALSEPIRVTPGLTETRTVFLSVGSAAGVSATEPLAVANPGAVPEQPFTLDFVTGTVVDPSGAGVGGVRLAIEAEAPGADWGVLDEAISEPDGSYRLSLLAFDAAWSYRLRAMPLGRDAGDTVSVAPGDTGVELGVGAAGSLAYDISGEGDATDAALVVFTREGDGAEQTRWLVGEDAVALAPGTWDWVATRGFEFAVQTGSLTVPDDGEAALALIMERVIDTTGFVSVDTHVHSSDSPDSRVQPDDVLRKAAAHGLDIVVHTEHEHIVDRSALAAELGVSHLTRGLTGEEVTATLPEHLTMFPAEPVGARGGPIEWYGRDIDEIFGLMRERSGGGVNIMNHPGFLDAIDWDPILAEPGVTDPTLFGLPADGALWSWNLDGIEVMNGHGNPFNNRRWRNWQSMVNAGHPMVAVGCSDSHGGDDIGFPRTYVPALSDVPSEVADQEIVDAFQGGQAQASSGAFARVYTPDGATLGDLVEPQDGAVELDVHIEALPEIDVDWVSVFVNCDEVLAVPASDPDGIIKISELITVPVDGDAAITLAAFGSERYPAGLPSFNPTGVPRVLTSPVYVDGDGDGVFSGGGGRECAVFLTPPDTDEG